MPAPLTETIQILHMELIHGSHIIHCNGKPANFLMGTGFCDKQVYITDFGLSKVYRDPKTHVHIGCGGDCDDILTGTAIYVSLNNHWGIKQTCHDDLESLAYMLIYFLCGSLPWSRVKTLTKKECHLIMQMKLNSLHNFLGGLPNEFTVFLNYTRALGFEGKPDCSFPRKLLRDLCIHEGHQYDQLFDWCSLSNTCLDDRCPSMRITKKKIDLEKDNAGTSCSSHCV